MSAIVETYQTYLACCYPFERHRIVFVDDAVAGTTFATRAGDCVGDTCGGAVYAGTSVYAGSFACGPEMIDQTYAVWRQIAFDVALSWLRAALPVETHADVWIVNGLAHYLAAQYCTRAFGRNETDHWHSLDVAYVVERDVVKTTTPTSPILSSSPFAPPSLTPSLPSVAPKTASTRASVTLPSVASHATVSSTQTLTLKQLEGRRRRAERRAVIAAAAAPRQGPESCVCNGGNSRPLYWTGYTHLSELHDVYAVKKAGAVMKMLEQMIGAGVMRQLIQCLLLLCQPAPAADASASSVATTVLKRTTATVASPSVPPCAPKNTTRTAPARAVTEEAKSVVATSDGGAAHKTKRGPTDEPVQETTGALGADASVVSTARFFAHASRLSGIAELAHTGRNTFADQWVFCNGHPRIYCAFHFDRKTYTADVTLTQDTCRCVSGGDTSTVDRGVRFAGDMTVRIHQVLNSLSLEHHRRLEDDELRLEFGILSRSRRTRKLQPHEGGVVAGGTGGNTAALTKTGGGGDARLPLAHMSAGEALLVSGDSPVLWIRADPLHTWLRPVTVEQDEAMWLQQLRNDRDAAAQLEALRALKKLGAWRLPVTTTELLTDIYEDEQLFHAVRIAAADTLASAPQKHVSLNADRVAEHLLARYRQRWFHASTGELRAYPLPHDFSDFADYRTKIGTLQALAHMRDPHNHGRTPPCIVAFLRHLLEYHDNAANMHSDVFYLQRVLRALGHLAFVTDATAADECRPDGHGGGNLRDARGEEIVWTGVVAGNDTRGRPKRSRGARDAAEAEDDGARRGQKRSAAPSQQQDATSGGAHKTSEAAELGAHEAVTAGGCSDGLQDVYAELLHHLEYDSVMASCQQRITCATLQAFTELELRHMIRPSGVDYTEYVGRAWPGNVRLTAFECMLSLACVRLEFLEVLASSVERERHNVVGIDMAVRWAESFETCHSTNQRRPLLLHCASSARSAISTRTRLWRLAASADVDARIRGALLRVLKICALHTARAADPMLAPRPGVSITPVAGFTSTRKQGAQLELARRRACRRLECADSAVATTPSVAATAPVAIRSALALKQKQR